MGDIRRAAGIVLVVLGTAAATAIVAFRWAPQLSSLSGLGSSGPGPIILISIDTLRADHVGAYGYDKVPTPNIDRLARDGVLFERAYAHAPQTLPSHTSILSGRLPFEHGVRDNMGFTVKPGERLLSQMLHERGFAAGGVVSAYVLRKETGINQGFDFFDSQLPPASPDQSIGQVQRDGAESLAVAEQWLNAQSSPLFFLFLHFYEPHKPYTPPARYAQYDPYDGEIAYADELVGRLMQSLRQRRLYDRAMIVLLSDHGEGLGDHGEVEHGLFLYDEAIHVPFIIKLPRNSGAGRRAAELVQHIDLVPTILDFVDAPRATGLRGRSLRPLLNGRGHVPMQGIYAEALYSRYHFGWSELYALTDDRYRFIEAPREELYDLRLDARERQNLAAERSQTRLAMKSALDALVMRAPLPVPTAIPADARERLQALGYVGAQADAGRASPSETLPDPKDKVSVLEDYRRSADLVGERKFTAAIELLQQIVAGNPTMADAWENLGNTLVRAGRLDEAVRAFERSAALTSHDTSARVAAASTLFLLRRLDEANQQAQLALDATPEKGQPHARAAAHEMLAKIALARKDETAARRHAELAHQADATVPLPVYVEGLIRYNHGEYDGAIPLLREAEQELRDSTLQLRELHYYLGDALGHLERYPEAEVELRQEIRLFPHETRARAALAMLYRAWGKDAESAQVIADLLRMTPTPEGYGLAARLWKMFGEPQRAEALRLEARQQFKGDPSLKLLNRGQD